MHWFLGSQCIAYTMCRKCRDVVDDPNDSTHCVSGKFIVDVVNVVVSLWVVNVATLPSYCLFVVSTPLWSMVYCCFFDCIGRNEVMRLKKQKNDNDAIIFSMLHFTNDHNEISIPLERSNYALSNDVIKKNRML